MTVTVYDLIDMGCYIFPVREKKPMVKWTKESTNDPEEVRNKKWESMTGRTGWGIDCGKSGLAVLDLDTGEGKHPEALDALALLEIEHGALPETYTVKTPSGGSHQYYRGAIKCSAGKLAPGIDTRGAGGYVVAPGSPGYEVVGFTSPVDVPEWLVSLVGLPTPKEERAPLAPDLKVDTDTAIRLAAQFLLHADPAIGGLHGDDHTYRVACGVRDYGVTEDVALQLMLEHWNPSCAPIWPVEELARKVANAYSYARRGLGGMNPENVFEPVPDAPESTRIVRPMFIDVHDLIRRPLVVEYLVEGLIERPTTGMLFGEPSAGKSLIAIDLALSVALGGSWFGHPCLQGQSVYFFGEGQGGMQRRIMAWMRHYKVDDIPEGGMHVSGSRLTIDEASVMALEPVLKGYRDRHGPISYICIDTLARHLRADLDENSARDVGGFINAVDYLRDRFSAAVMVVHHTPKGDRSQSRGSSALRGAMDWEARVTAEHQVIWTKQKESELPPPLDYHVRKIVLGPRADGGIAIPGPDPNGRREEFEPGDPRRKGRPARKDSMAMKALRLFDSMAESYTDGWVPREDWQAAFLRTWGTGKPNDFSFRGAYRKLDIEGLFDIDKDNRFRRKATLKADFNDEE